MALHQHATEFRARNLLLQMCLGLHRHALTLRALVDRYAPPDAPRVAAAPGDGELILALLGLTALLERVTSHLERAAADAPPAPAPAVGVGVSRGILR